MEITGGHDGLLYFHLGSGKITVANAHLIVSQILALARAGATGLAWDTFVSANLVDNKDDPKILTLKGRLLKDQARMVQGGARAQLFLRSAQAYADASALGPDSYPLINAATMSLFAGQPDHMRTLANEVLALIQTGVGRGETPYWHAATRAEALLLLGDIEAAKISFAEAVALTPQAWEDHATTLRQFRLILSFRNEDSAWLLPLAPASSLYFSGMIGLSPDDAEAKRAIDQAVADTKAGFGYGALAAGADILIAEALVNSGAELHVLLPVIPSLFKTMSVDPFGAEWSDRFDVLFETAASVEIIDGGQALSFAAIDVAAQVARGRAINNAARMESAVTGLRVVDVDQQRGKGNPVSAGLDDKVIALARSAPPPNNPDIGASSQYVLVAARARMSEISFPGASGIKEHNDHIVAAFGDLATAQTGVEAVRRHRPDISLAVNLVVGSDPMADEGRHAQLIRMVEAAAKGTIIAGTEAAMSLKALNPAMWIEPLGAIPDAAGAINVFAIAVTANNAHDQDVSGK